MSEHYTCRCGEVLDDDCQHNCPGTPNERIDTLESEVAALSDQVALKLMWVGFGFADGVATMVVTDSKEAALKHASAGEHDGAVVRWLCAVNGTEATLLLPAKETCEIGAPRAY